MRTEDQSETYDSVLMARRVLLVIGEVRLDIHLTISWYANHRRLDGGYARVASLWQIKAPSNETPLFEPDRRKITIVPTTPKS